MSEVSLYRKYRPMNFQNLVGQDHVRTTLINATKKDNLSHAYLFCGPRGTGKTSTARLVAKIINCLDLQDDYEPCNKCEICESINEGRLIDIIEIDAASNRGIDEMRELKERIDFAPTNAKTKVYIIDEVHMLTKEAFNALLKTLEEPPAHAYFILATTEVHKIPETIISRCQRFDFKRITEKTIMTRLNYIAQLEKIDVEDGAIQLIAHYVDGGMRDAIGLLEQLTSDGKLSYEHVCTVLGMSDHESIERLYNTLVDGDTVAALGEAKNVHGQGYNMSQFLKSFLEYLRERMLEALSGKHEPSQAAWFLKAIDIFQEATQQIRLTVIPQLPLEVAIISLCEDGLSEPKSSTQTKVEVASSKKIEEKKVEVKKQELKDEVQDEELKDEEKHEIVLGDDPSLEDLDGLKELPAEEPSNEDVEMPKPALGLIELKKQLPRVIEHISVPSVRMSFQTGHAHSINGHDVVFEFSTSFHMNKVMEHDNRVLIEKALEDVFGVKVKLQSRLKKVDLEPAVANSEPEMDFANSDKAENVEKSSASQKEQQDMANAALDIFGGEFID